MSCGDNRLILEYIILLKVVVHGPLPISELASDRRFPEHLRIIKDSSLLTELRAVG